MTRPAQPDEAPDHRTKPGPTQAAPAPSVQVGAGSEPPADVQAGGQGPATGAGQQDDVPKPSPESLPLPEALQAIDDQIRAALIMVAHGNARLSKLAGNIRFSYLQRDESRLIGERRQLKTAFQQGESTEAELKLALQALLQKAERQAGTLLPPPTKAPAAVGESPEPPLPPERGNQIRRALREAMMSLAAAAPLHLQIELAPTFADTEPDIMAMAARIHALHRQVLGSLKAIRWRSQTSCVLTFDDGKESREVEASFGEQGITSLPAAYRQNQQKPAQAARPGGGQGKAGQNRRGPGAGARPANRTGGAAGAGQAAGPRARTGEASSNPPKGRPDHSRPQADAHRPSANADGTSDNGQQPSKIPPRGQSGHHGDPRTGGDRSPENRGRSHERRPRPGRQPSGNRRADGQDQRGNRGTKSFPSNSAMADKLRAALGGQLNLPKSKKG